MWFIVCLAVLFYSVVWVGWLDSVWKFSGVMNCWVLVVIVICIRVLVLCRCFISLSDL